MGTSMLTAFLLVSALGFAFSNPMQPVSTGHQTPRCLQPKVTGLCLAYFPSYYYNQAKDACEEFIYGGCQGNDNRFFSEQECLTACKGFKLEPNDFKLILDEDFSKPSEDQSKSLEDQTESREDKSSEEEEDACSQPMKIGPCLALIPRFHFNGKECESFNWGGCRPNSNNFRSLDECIQKCRPTSAKETSAEEQADSAAASETSAEEQADGAAASETSAEEQAERAAASETSAEEQADSVAASEESKESNEEKA